MSRPELYCKLMQCSVQESAIIADIRAILYVDGVSSVYVDFSDGI